jgi:hypothetical protein
VAPRAAGFVQAITGVIGDTGQLIDLAPSLAVELGIRVEGAEA